MKEIKVPDGMTTISAWALKDRTSLTGVAVPASVTTIGDNAFGGCNRLIRVTFLTSGKCGDNVTWSFDGKVLTVSGTGKMDDYSSEHKAPWALFDIEKIIIEDGITTIGNVAFKECLTLPVDIKREDLWRYLFYDSNLKDLKIPDSVIVIGDEAFSGCTGLTSITIPDSVAAIGREAFNGCCSLKDITIPDSVKTIGSSAFSGCCSLTGIIIPASVIFVSDRTFAACESLKRVIISSGVKRIGEEAFNGCIALKKVIIADEVTSLAKGAFRNCTSLHKVKLPLALEEVGEEIFSGCSNLKKVHHKKGADFVDKLRVGNSANFYPIT